MNPQQTRILIIEDDPAVAGSLQEGLEREGYSVAWKNTGQAGVTYARDHHPHLIILDIRLPDGSGFDFCREMRQLKLTQPILMLTVRRDDVDKILGLEMGADEYVTKPFSLQVLRSRIRALLRRAYGELSVTDSDVIHAGDLIIDRTRGQAWRGDHMLNLTPTEFRLLTLLAQNAGRALTRRQILDAIWGNADIESERMVNVHIRRLREKAEMDPSNPVLILTIPGVGYRFEG
jgi:DNA-binding response OmpR family regulator